MSYEVALGLGTAQLAAPYGSAHKTLPPTPQEAIVLVREALRLGIRRIDTARAYGDSEARLGEALTGDWATKADIVTKLSPLDDLDKDAGANAVRNAVNASIENSRRALRKEPLETVLLHRASHLTAWNGEVWKQLLELRDCGKVCKLGVSVQTVQDLVQALKFKEVTHVQMPFNVLDFRWARSNILKKVQERPSLTVDVRSVLLQGVLISSEKMKWPRIPELTADTLMKWLEDCTRRFRRRSVADLCYGYVRAQPWISAIIVGMENLDQLKANVGLFAEQPLSLHECTEMERTRPQFPMELLSPEKWTETA